MNKWEIVPYTRGKVLQPLGELLFPHFQRDLEGEIDALVGEGPSEQIRIGGFWCQELTIMEKRVEGFFAVPRPPEGAKTCTLIRLGAWGDLMMMTSILPKLKADGYHVTLHCSPRGYDVVKHDPRIDSFVLQDPDQVPPTQLTEYFEYLRTRCDKFINLCESIEGSCLAMPGRPISFWSKEARHMAMNMNYVELTHKIAEVPFVRPQILYQATKEEEKDCETFLKQWGGSPNILWVISGSAVHKVYPHMDAVIARILLKWPEARVFLVGEEACEYIELPWVKEPRVVRMSGIATIRQTILLAHYCDLVIGPETGIMSAVSMQGVGKVVFLSHSTKENLTRDWVNTQSLASKKTECYPCHKMIFGWDQCRQGKETGAAQCQEDISPDDVWLSVQKLLGKVSLRRAA